jgi:serine protease Do
MNTVCIRWSLLVSLVVTYSAVRINAEDSVAPADEKKLVPVLAISEAFKELVRVSRPSVVSISSIKHPSERQTQRRKERRLPEAFPRDFFDDDFIERFFDFNFGFPKGDLEQRGLGSGVIVRQDGYILTNNHVVGGADEVNVTLADKRQLPAKIVGTDKLTDLAVLKIDAAGLPTAKLGDSSQTAVGEWVLAIGCPFGLEQTVTAGIISATERTKVGITAYEDFLQTDAAINPGNSGGPLVNLRGEVIGINTAIASRTGGYMGVGFSIPSHQARVVFESILKDGSVTRGWLGAAIQDLTSDLAESFHYDRHDGVLIDDVTAKSPADKAGLRTGDIVIGFNGHPVSDANQLRNAVAAQKPNSKVDIEVIRDGKPVMLKVSVGLLKDDIRHESIYPESEPNDALGVSVDEISPELRNQFKIPNDEHGLVISGVDPGSLAANAGIRSGDLLLAVGSQSVETLKDYRKACRDLDLARGVRLQIKRDGIRRFIFLRQTNRS